MEDNEPLVPQRCKDLVMAVMVGALEDLLNNKNLESKLWLETSSLAEIGFQLLGIPSCEALAIVDRLIESEGKIYFSHLVSKEYYDRLNENIITARVARAKETKPRKTWNKRRLNNDFQTF